MLTQPILQKYAPVPTIEDLLVTLSSRMELNVIDLINPKTWAEQQTYHSTLFTIFASDTSGLDQKHKNLLALLVINTI